MNSSVFDDSIEPTCDAGQPVDVDERARLIDDSTAELLRFRRQMSDLLMTLRGRLPDENQRRLASVDETQLIQQLEASNGQLLKLCESFADLMTKQTAAEAKLVELSSQIEVFAKDAHTDALTGVANRRGFDHELAHQVQNAHQTGAPLSLILVDVDRFKAFNDNFGHTAGDTVLRTVGATLRRAIRSRDTVARYGGEEFAIILPGARVEDAVLTAERMRRMIEQSTLQFDGGLASVTVSCGVAQLIVQEHAGYLIQRTDEALYASKQDGRNMTHWHSGVDQRLLRARQMAVPSGGEEATRGSETIGNRIAKRPTDAMTPGARASATKSSTSLRGMGRTNWCDTSTFYWWIRQRLAEKRHRDACFSVALVDIENFDLALRQFGEPAAELLNRTHRHLLDSRLSTVDVVTEYRGASVAVAMPNTPLAGARELLERLGRDAANIVLPTSRGMLEYRLRSSVVEPTVSDDAVGVLARAEALLHARSAVSV